MPKSPTTPTTFSSGNRLGKAPRTDLTGTVIERGHAVRRKRASGRARTADAKASPCLSKDSVVADGVTDAAPTALLCSAPCSAGSSTQEKALYTPHAPESLGNELASDNSVASALRSGASSRDWARPRRETARPLSPAQLGAGGRSGEAMLRPTQRSGLCRFRGACSRPAVAWSCSLRRESHKKSLTGPESFL